MVANEVPSIERLPLVPASSNEQILAAADAVMAFVERIARRAAALTRAGLNDESMLDAVKHEAAPTVVRMVHPHGLDHFRGPPVTVAESEIVQ